MTKSEYLCIFVQFIKLHELTYKYEQWTGNKSGTCIGQQKDKQGPLFRILYLWRTYEYQIYNPGQDIWNKIEKSSKTGQDKKSLISNFACFLTAIAKV